VLLVHCAGQDALIFGAQKEEEAIDSAIRQIAKIHPEIITEFEFGKVKAWFSDSSE
jgi:monoamine oxidase